MGANAVKFFVIWGSCESRKGGAESVGCLGWVMPLGDSRPGGGEQRVWATPTRMGVCSAGLRSGRTGAFGRGGAQRKFLGPELTLGEQVPKLPALCLRVGRAPGLAEFSGWSRGLVQDPLPASRPELPGSRGPGRGRLQGVTAGPAVAAGRWRRAPGGEGKEARPPGWAPRGLGCAPWRPAPFLAPPLSEPRPSAEPGPAPAVFL